MTQHSIKNIIFDVGKVLLEYRWKDMLMEYGLDADTAEHVGNTVFSDPNWAGKYDMGLWSTQEMIEYFNRTYPDIAEYTRYFIERADLMPVKLPAVWEQVARLHAKGYRCYILSNYSEHLFALHTKGCDFLKEMDGGIVSYQVHLIKPDKKIYEALLNKYQLIPEECIFFDDRKENVEGAIACGMQAKQVVDTESFIEDLKVL